MAELILDVGCGNNKNINAVGIDQAKIPGVDIVCDLNKPWPLKSHTFNKIIFRHSINHLNDLNFILHEVARVAKPEAKVEIIAPHFSSDNIFTDPTIKFFIGYRSFNYYCSNTPSNYDYYSSIKFSLEHRWIHLYKSDIKRKRDSFINLLLSPLEYLINLFPRLYEKFFCFILRANEIRFILRIAK